MGPKVRRHKREDKVSQGEKDRLWSEVVYRDNGICQGCGSQGAEVHHIIARGHAPDSPKLWRLENMCCACKDCHDEGNTKGMRRHLLGVMGERHGYDMSWAAEFGWPMALIYEMAESETSV